MRAARRSSTTTCASCGRCSPRRRTYQRTVYRPGETGPVRPLGAAGRDPGRPWPDYVAAGSSPASSATRAPAPGRWSSPRQAPDIALGHDAAAWPARRAAARRLVWDREGGDPRRRGRPTDAFAAFCGQLRGRLADPRGRATAQAKGMLERSHRFMRSQLRAGRARFANELDFQDQLDAWLPSRPTRASTAASARVPAERLAEERELMRPLPRADARARPALRDPRAGRSPTCASTPTTTRSIRGWPAAGSRCGSPSARSRRRRAGHRRARRPPPPLLRASPDLHRPRPPGSARPAARRAPSRPRGRGRDARRWPAMTR